MQNRNTKPQTVSQFISEVDAKINVATNGEWKFNLNLPQEILPSLSNKTQTSHDDVNNFVVEIQTSVNNDYEIYIQNKINIENEIRIHDDKIKKINSLMNKIINNQIQAGISCCCGILAIFGAFVFFEEGMDDLNQGNFSLGLIEEINSWILLDLATHDLERAAENTRANIRVPSISDLERLRDQYKIERKKLQQNIYTIEKNETLRILEQKEKNKDSIFCAAVTNQFKEIDCDIENGKFSKTYIDIAINTKKMIMTPHIEKRNQYAAKHVAITTKESVSKVVCGCMMIVAGIIVAVGAACLTAFLIEATPFALFLGAVGVLSGLGLILDGANKIQSGIARERTPLVTQSIFKVANLAKVNSEEHTIASQKYNTFAYSHR